MKASIIVFGLIMALASPATAQLRGLGRVQGKLVDGAGVPVNDVTVTATLPGVAGSLIATSDKNGDWRVAGMARGKWDVSFVKPGFSSARAAILLDIELGRVPLVTVTMKSTR